MTSIVDRSGGKSSWVQVAGDKYMVCGTDLHGKRVRIVSNNWMYIDGINVYNGRKYLIRSGKRYLINVTTN